jgi:hypothetical protein
MESQFCQECGGHSGHRTTAGAEVKLTNGLKCSTTNPTPDVALQIENAAVAVCERICVHRVKGRMPRGRRAFVDYFRYLSKSGNSSSLTSGFSKSGLVITRALKSIRLGGLIPCR